jgi:NCS1 family nucleobase:cation symporter-1
MSNTSTRPPRSIFFDLSGGSYGRVGGIGIAAYIVGIAVEIPFMSTELYTGRPPRR